MDDYRLIYPMFVLVLHTFIVVVRLFLSRMRSAKEGTTDLAYFKAYQNGSEPESSAKLARHFVNLFEAPVLFYTVCITGLVTNVTGTLYLVLAWTYVLIRMVHTYIHTGKNDVMVRASVYFFSWFVLLSMWVLLVFSVATKS